MIDHIFNALSPEMLVVGSVIVTFVVLLAYKWPEICFLLGLPTLLFLGQFKDIFPVSVSASAAFFPFVAVVGKGLRRGQFDFRRFGYCEKLLIGLALLMVYSVSYSAYPAYGWEKAILFCFMVIPIIVFSPKVFTNVWSLHRAIGFVTVVFVIYVLSSALLLIGMGTIEWRMSSFGDVTRSGQFLGVASILCFVHGILGRHGIVRKFFYICLMTIGLFLLLVSGTRAALLGYVVTLLFIYWFTHIDWFSRVFMQAGKTFAIIVFVTMLIVASMFILEAVLPPQILDRFTSVEAFFSNFTLNEIDNWQSSDSRALNYFSAIEGLKSHPLSGVGAGGYVSVLGGYREIRATRSAGEVIHSYPHNMILEFAVEQGVLGLLLILYVLYLNLKMVLALRVYIHRNPLHRLLVTCCVSIYVYGLLVSMTSLDIPRMMILWWGMGLLIATDRIYCQPWLFYAKNRKPIKHSDSILSEI